MLEQTTLLFQDDELRIGEPDHFANLAVKKATEDHCWRIIEIKADEKARAKLSQRRHDIVGATRTLSLALQSIREGYRFDDDLAELKLNTMLAAVTTLEKETRLLENLLTLPMK